MSDSEELLMSSRARRSNAGNKMQKLIDQERQEMQEKTANLDDDEIYLLFQEDEDDEEFRADSKRGKDEDERLSESDDESEGEDDEEAGERELERQERKKRKQTRKFSAPVIRKRAKPSEDVVKPQYEQPKADSLLLDNRRTSKRSSVVANKLQIYEKLAQAEKKREKIQNRLRQTKAKMAYVELTQEERLRQAEETELINTQSLTKFREEEIFKKETRIAMNLRKKAKFAVGQIMIRVNTTAWAVTPIMEIKDREYWEQQLGKRHKKKKKYTRRKKDKDEKNEKKSPDAPSVGNKDRDQPSSVDKTQCPNDLSQQTGLNQASVGNGIECTGSDQKGGSPQPRNDVESSFSPPVCENIQGDTSRLVEPDLKTDVQQDSAPTQQNIQEQSSETLLPPSDKPSIKEESDVPKASVGCELPAPSEPVDANGKEETPSSKQVSFASETDVTTFDHSLPSNTPLSKEHSLEPESSRQNSEEPLDEIEGNTDAFEVFEGPEQLVGRNFVTLYSYPEENLTVHDIRPFFFGSQWARPLNSRSEDVETIAKIYNEQNEDEWMDVNSTLIPDTLVFDTFPSFGEYDKKVSTEIAEETDTKLKLEIKTAAPAGVILPNGVRKKCLITNRDCQYFDPKNGVPYADVESYKIVQELQDPIGEGNSDTQPSPQFKWFGFARGGIFLDVKQPAAKGVPEGF
ncbi:LAME_0F06678g1_1 [Lachancea meyersii CBS 8951]|uniref:LAME_0F06678g1_1 n=1 Tax=Lachancea meyersii CBS 8951 TaxID=1266667 RepID=A0A1G4JTL4_9SACH|nr:LAME_0F06678g1_1 [Lachancea meyersii CBS 8951]